MFKRKRSSKGYWFTIVAANNQVLATSETYTTPAMRDKGIEAVKKVVKVILAAELVAEAIKENSRRRYPTSGTGWKVSEVKRDRRFAKKRDDLDHDPERAAQNARNFYSRKPSDTFHLENKKGKIVKG